jgi:hypothetical protein
MSAPARLTTVVIDCTAPDRLAEFYGTVTGWEVTYRDDDCVYLGDGGPIQLGFQRVAGYRPPTWPSPDKQAHLDFTVTDVDQVTKELLTIGATRPEFQPGGEQWTVLADPEGHLLCLVAQE